MRVGSIRYNTKASAAKTPMPIKRPVLPSGRCQKVLDLNDSLSIDIYLI